MPPQRPGPRWIKEELTFAQVRDRIEAEPDCTFERMGGAGIVGGRFVRTFANDRKRFTAPFVADKFERKIDPGTVASWCKALDLDCTKFGVDEPWG